jgi:hypothetical protein
LIDLLNCQPIPEEKAMLQYSDNIFSGAMPFDEALAKFQDCIANKVPVMALHVGTERQLQQRKQAPDLQAEIAELRNRVEAMEPAPKSTTLYLPSVDEARKFGKAI